MTGIQYLTDAKGKKTAVVINLKDYQEEIEEFLEGLEAKSRLNEPSVDFETAVAKILNSKKKNARTSTKN